MNAEKQYVAVKVYLPRSKGGKKGKSRIAQAHGPMDEAAADALYSQFMAENRDGDGVTFIGVCELVAAS